MENLNSKFLRVELNHINSELKTIFFAFYNINKKNNNFMRNLLNSDKAYQKELLNQTNHHFTNIMISL